MGPAATLLRAGCVDLADRLVPVLKEWAAPSRAHRSADCLPLGLRPLERVGVPVNNL